MTRHTAKDRPVFVGWVSAAPPTTKAIGMVGGAALTHPTPPDLLAVCRVVVFSAHGPKSVTTRLPSHLSGLVVSGWASTRSGRHRFGPMSRFFFLPPPLRGLTGRGLLGLVSMVVL